MCFSACRAKDEASASMVDGDDASAGIVDGIHYRRRQEATDIRDYLQKVFLEGEEAEGRGNVSGIVLDGFCSEGFGRLNHES